MQKCTYNLRRSWSVAWSVGSELLGLSTNGLGIPVLFASTHAHTWTHLNLNCKTYIQPSTSSAVHTCARAHTHTQANMHTHAHTHTHTRTCTCTHTHTHTNTHTHCDTCARAGRGVGGVDAAVARGGHLLRRRLLLHLPRPQGMNPAVRPSCIPSQGA